MAPRDTPKEVIARLNKEVNAVLASADVKKRLADAGIETVDGMPEELARWLQAEAKKWSEIIRSTGAKID
jgi:tripartite-type tricarboxylate transporter receptor subunit TctC